MPSEITVKVLAYNVAMLDQFFIKGQGFRNKDRAKVIANLLARSDNDVIIFSEAFDNGAREDMIKILQPTFPERTAIVGNDDDIKISQVLLATAALGGKIGGVWGAIIGLAVGGLAVWLTGSPKSDGGIFIMSKWPIVLQGQIVYKKSASEDRLGRKGVSWALINKEGFYFHVFGTHTQADAEFYSIRQAQFSELSAMTQAVGMLWQPALIGGDLNVDFCLDKDRCPPPVVDAPPVIDRPRGPGGRIIDGRILDGRDIDGPTIGGGGDADVPFTPGGDCCDQQGRVDMLRALKAALPGNLSRFTYTSDPNNDHGGIINWPRRPPPPPPPSPRGTTLDYVLYVKDPSTRPYLRPVPLRTSLETVRLRGVVAGREMDLSDHHAVVGTYTFPFKREETTRFVGTWKCIKFNNQADSHNHRLTFHVFGKNMINEFDGRKEGEIIHHITPGKETAKEKSGKVVIKNLVNNKLVEYDYLLKSNEEFKRYFIPGDVTLPGGKRLLQQQPRPQNELLLRNATRSMLYAFESWLPVEIGEIRPSGGPV